MAIAQCVAGVEDGSFTSFLRGERQRCMLCAVVMEGRRIKDVKASLITVDGTDSTSRLVSMVEGQDIEALLLGGITFAGFNVVDAKRVSRDISRPVIVYIRRKPDNAAVKAALVKHFRDALERWKLIDSLGPMYEYSSGGRRAYFEVVDGDRYSAQKILQDCTFFGSVPEVLRVSGIIAKSLSIRDC